MLRSPPPPLIFGALIAFSILAIAVAAANIGDSVVIPYQNSTDIGGWTVKVTAIGTATSDPAWLDITHAGQTKSLSLNVNATAGVTLGNDSIKVKVTKIVPGSAGAVTVLLSGEQKYAACNEKFVPYQNTTKIGSANVKVTAVGTVITDPVGFEVSIGGETKAFSMAVGEATDATIGGVKITISVIKVVPGSAGGGTISICEKAGAAAPKCDAPTVFGNLSQEVQVPYQITASVGAWSVKTTALGTTITDPAGILVCRGNETQQFSLAQGDSQKVTLGGKMVTVSVTKVVPGSAGAATVKLAEAVPAPPATCSDTDGGRSPFVIGNVSGTDSSGRSYGLTDACRSASQLLEFYCDGNRSANYTVNCLAGCKNGACAIGLPARTCTDTDGGIQPNRTGNVSGTDSTGRPYTLTDTCRSNKTVLEFYCDRGQPANRTINCDGICVAGACKAAPGASCTDTDGGDKPFMIGNTTATDSTGRAFTHTDFCFLDRSRNTTRLVEFYCSGSSALNRTVDCANGCQAGACKQGFVFPFFRAVQDFVSTLGRLLSPGS